MLTHKSSEGEPRDPAWNPKLVLNTIANVLDMDPCGITSDSDFYDLGMDSLLVMEVVSKLRKKGLECSVYMFFEHSSLRKLEEYFHGKKPKIIGDNAGLPPISSH